MPRVCRYLVAEASKGYDALPIQTVLFQNNRDGPGEKGTYMSKKLIEPGERLAMSVEEAALAVGVGRSKLYQEIQKNGSLRSVKLGGRRVIRRIDLEAWLEANAA